MRFEEVLNHYSRQEVVEELVAYCKGRWIALEGGAAGSRVFLRYWRDGRPLRIRSVEELNQILRVYRGVKPRTVYGSVNIYVQLDSVDNFEAPQNIAYTSPIWDVDGSLEAWGYVVEAAKVIVDFLEREGVSKSVFLKWSGEGMHIHIHELAFSKDLLSNHNSLDIAFSLVEYVLRKARERLLEVASKSGGVVKVENEMDLKRVFTAPLSLHRRRDLCCVCFKPEAIDSFEPEWANPASFKHDPSWKAYVEGEADGLAEKALAEIGGYTGWPGMARTAKSVSVQIQQPRTLPSTGRIGRFQVMGLLQAARYYLLTGDLEKAKSFGLNRAIFYAWAKKRGAVKPRTEALRPSYIKEGRGEKLVQIGDEGAYVSGRGWFMIGDTEQTPQDYDRQIAHHIASVASYEEVWKAALNYLKAFPRVVLQDQQRFFNEAYKPVRDNFLEAVRRERRGKYLTLDTLLGKV